MKTPWSKTPNAHVYVTEYSLINPRSPHEVLKFCRKNSVKPDLSAKDIIDLDQSLRSLTDSSRKDALIKLLGSQKHSRGFPDKIPTPLSKAFSCSSALSERLWTTTSDEYGKRNTSNPPPVGHRLSTAKWYIPDHPYWNENSREKGRGATDTTTYMDLGRVECIVPSTA